MLEFPSDWVQQFGVNLVTAYPPQGGGRFRYCARLRPQPTFSAILSQILASDSDFKVHHIGQLMRLVTLEGEYGAWVKVEGKREGSPAIRYLGAVFLGEFATSLDCIVIVPKQFAEFELLSLKLLRSERHYLAQRPRQFFYVPPVGWQGIPTGLVTHFYPLDFPNNRTTIAVLPASVCETETEQAVEISFAAAGAGLTVDSSVRDELASNSGVKGHILRLLGRRAGGTDPIHRELVMFVVPPYAYRLRLETTAAPRLLELREIFHGVAKSFQPLPATGTRSALGPSSVDLLDCWVS